MIGADKSLAASMHQKSWESQTIGQVELLIHGMGWLFPFIEN